LIKELEDRMLEILANNLDCEVQDLFKNIFENDPSFLIEKINKK